MGSKETIYGLELDHPYIDTQKIIPPTTGIVERAMGNFPTVTEIITRSFRDLPKRRIDVVARNLMGVSFKAEEGIPLYDPQGEEGHDTATSRIGVEIYTDILDPNPNSQKSFKRFGLEDAISMPFALKRALECTAYTIYGITFTHWGVRVYRPDAKSPENLRLAYYTMVPSPQSDTPDTTPKRNSVLIASFDFEKVKSFQPDK